ncbi:sugar phosphate isomerase/epimerase [Candidatus Poribacteria bacterium]|nr:MAG: sugar phosphate isomerase/epimerase [Candidatus Poribacteria bacterium]
MRVGLDDYTISFMNLDPFQTIDYAEKLGAEGVQFGSVAKLAPNWREEELLEVKGYADRKGMYIEVNIPSVNPYMYPPGRRKGLVRTLRKHIELAALAGGKGLRSYIGWKDNRFDPKFPPWEVQLEDTVKVLKQLAPLARDLGVKIALETHMDATTFELLRVIEEVGEEAVGICLDTGNLTMCLEDPLEATRRVAPHVVATHLKDSILTFGERGLRWQARPCGEGIVPLEEMLSILSIYNPDLTLSIEDHPRIYELPIFDRAWLSKFGDLTPIELAEVVRLAVEAERRIRRGEIRPPEEEEAIPWEERAEGRIRKSISYLKGVLG